MARTRTATKRTKTRRHEHTFGCAVDPECPENVRSGWSHGWRAAKSEYLREMADDHRPLTRAMLTVLRAIGPLARDEQQRVLLAVADLLALDRPERSESTP